MIDDLILSFPVLKDGGGDFLESVSYVVEATQAQHNRKLYITHTLKGSSFIAQLIRDGKAKFSVSLFYKDNAERQKFVCEGYDDERNEITAEQEIDIDFRYAPEITPNIIIVKNVKITVDSNSGLGNFWEGEIFDIPAYARIAHYLKLKFTSGDVSSLMWKDMDESYSNGVIKTIVDENKGEGGQPIKIICAQDVYDELNKGFSGDIDVKMAMRQSIITQVLCHVYAHMSNLKDDKNDMHSGLLIHMENVKKETGQDWESDDFNPSFAATNMMPYAIEALNKEYN